MLLNPYLWGVISMVHIMVHSAVWLDLAERCIALQQKRKLKKKWKKYILIHRWKGRVKGSNTLIIMSSNRI